MLQMLPAVVPAWMCCFRSSIWKRGFWLWPGLFRQDKYSWKPEDSARSVAQIFMRIADSAKLMDSLAGR